MQSLHDIPSRHGFTLLELSITLVVLAILLCLALPSLKGWQDKQAMRTALNTLRQDLVAARSHAIALGDRIVICPGTNGEGCSSSDAWNTGWFVFEDLDQDREFDMTEPVLKIEGHHERLNITSAISRSRFVFYPNGTAPGSNGSIWFCGARGPQFGHRLVVSNLGRIRSEPYQGLEWEDCPTP